MLYGVFAGPLIRPQLKGKWSVSQLICSYLSLFIKEYLSFMIYAFGILLRTLPKPNAKYGQGLFILPTPFVENILHW